jgi:hypothetical protein
MNPKYPIYIVSKGRWKSRLTSKALDRMRVPYRIIVEAQEFDQYAAEVGAERLLVLPRRYLEEYDACDELGLTKSKGPGAARNFAWDHAISEGAAWHWVMDDNFEHFYRLNRNMRVICETGSIFRAAEDFVDRYENVGISGFNYHGFAKAVDALPPYVLNTRIYSCLLIRNDIPYRWRGRYNEDTDLSLRALKDKWVTVQFNAFLCGKVATQRMQGGNTRDFYAEEGTKNKSQMLADLHPDVAKVVWKFRRWHHHVDYRPFKSNKLRRKPTALIPNGANEFGMRLKELEK